jgi:archaeosortase A (PGF-CTERM-specific)
MLGVTCAVKTTLMQKVIAVLMIISPVYLLNLLRNTGVVIAYTEQWFPYFQEYVGGNELGFASFFWSHNVIAEGLAFLFLIVLSYGLFRLIPTLADFAIDLLNIYRSEVVALTSKPNK